MDPLLVEVQGWEGVRGRAGRGASHPRSPGDLAEAAQPRRPQRPGSPSLSPPGPGHGAAGGEGSEQHEGAPEPRERRETGPGVRGLGDAPDRSVPVIWEPRPWSTWQRPRAMAGAGGRGSTEEPLRNSQEPRPAQAGQQTQTCTHMSPLKGAARRCGPAGRRGGVEAGGEGSVPSLTLL